MGRLVVTRHPGESVELHAPYFPDGKIVVTLLKASKEGGQSRLVFDAPESVRIVRSELNGTPNGLPKIRDASKDYVRS